jgi:stage III sporulation protein AF
MVQWIKEIVVLLLFGGLLIMIVPDTELKPFLRLVVGLLLIALLIQPLAGTNILISSYGIAARLEESLQALGRAGFQSPRIEHQQLQVQAERLVEKGSGVVREHMENQANRQLGALLSLFAGVDAAQVATQVNAQGQLERVLVQLHLSGEGTVNEPELLSATDTSGDEVFVPLVRPVLVTEQSLQAKVSEDTQADPLVKRVRSWVADFYGIDTKQVIVTTM